jgi:hypothetical protein
MQPFWLSQKSILTSIVTVTFTSRSAGSVRYHVCAHQRSIPSSPRAAVGGLATTAWCVSIFLRVCTSFLADELGRALSAQITHCDIFHPQRTASCALPSQPH